MPFNLIFHGFHDVRNRRPSGYGNTENRSYQRVKVKVYGRFMLEDRAQLLVKPRGDLFHIFRWLGIIA